MESYWWPAAFTLRNMLMDGKGQELRLAHYQTYLSSKSEEDSEMEPNAMDYAAVKLLRYARCEMDLQRENQECREGRPTAFPSFKALKEDQRNRKERLDSVTRREDDTLGDLVTVLVLTRRK